MELERLCSELEGLFDLDELKQLGSKLLGVSPAEVGGSSAKASFVRALVDHCVERDALEALSDAAIAWRSEVGPELSAIHERGFYPAEELREGDRLGETIIVRKLGDSALGYTYLAQHDGRNVRLKILNQAARRDRRGVERFFTLMRLVGDLDHQGLPRNVYAGGFEGGHRGVLQDYVQGEVLSEWLERVGPRRFTEIPDLLRQMLEPLAVLHKNRIVHGNLTLSNLLWCVNEVGMQYVVLLDPGTNQIKQRKTLLNGKDNRMAQFGHAESVAPELIRGEPASPRSDAYACGAIIYQLLTGRAPFAGGSALDSVIGHLTREATPVSAGAEGAAVPAEVDAFVARLLSKDPLQRPANAQELLEQAEAVARSSLRVLSTVTAEEISNRLNDLLSEPWNEEAAASLEATVDAGADADQLAEGFRWVSDQLDPGQGMLVERAKKSMLFRAARIYEQAGDRPDAAEELYAHLLGTDPHDDSAAAALERVRRKQGKHEEIVEDLLAKTETAETGVERGRLMAEIGKIYKEDLNDSEQALVAFTQALCEDPDDDKYAEQVERLAGTEHSIWDEVLGSCIETIKEGALLPESKNRLLVRMGVWYRDKINRPDLALPMYQEIMTTDPANDEALDGLCSIYRKAQQWAELGQALIKRAETAGPSLRRDLQAEAGEVLETRLNNMDAARELYEQVLEEDPGHEKASNLMAALCARVDDNEGYVKVLEKRAASVGGEQKVRALCDLAEAYEDRLNDLNKAAMCYEDLLRENPQSLDALKGLDRVYNRQGRYPDLIENLERQLALAVTGRQKINLWMRMSGIYEEEFLDHQKAAQVCENVLEIDPEYDEALTALARHYRSMERWMDVVTVFERHLELLTDNSRRADKAMSLGAVLHEKLGLTERAIEAYETALSAAPSDPAALDALAKLRASAGDAERALEAIEILAEEAKTPKERAAQYLRAAELLESRGDSEAALERYKWAVDADSDDLQLTGKLRAAYVKHGDAESAVELLESEIEKTEGKSVKARLSGEMAVLCHEHLLDNERANAAARIALKLDPTNVHGLMVLGHIAYKEGKYVEASKRYSQVVNHAKALTAEQALLVYTQYIDALGQTDDNEKALGIIDDLLVYAADDPMAMIRATEIVSEHGAPYRALDLNTRLLQDFGEELSHDEKARAMYRQGDAARKMEDYERAQRCLEEALDVDPSLSEAYTSLAKVFEEQQDWRNAIGTLYKQQECAVGDERADVLTQIADLAAEKLDDADYAANIYLTALGERPDDRKIMMKLMQLYSQSKDWEKLISVIMRLAELVDDAKQKAKYLHTASMVASRELLDIGRAMELLDEALKHDPNMAPALDEALKLRTRIGDHEAVKELLKLRVKQASEAGDNDALLKALDQLAGLYHHKLNRLERAIEVHQEALAIDPKPEKRRALLTRLYLEDPHRYFDQAIKGLDTMIKNDPFQPDGYKALRRLYTEVRRPDGAFLACQALCALNRADPDEVKFYNRMHSDDPAAAQDRITEQDWNQLVMHPDVDPMLTALFVLIEPAVTQARAEHLESLGYTEHHMIHPDDHPYGCVYALNYAAEVMGMRLPPLYQNTNDPGALNFLHAHTPAIVCGQAATDGDLPGQMATFIAARHLAYYRAGLYVRQIVPTSAGLKSWLFAAIKLITPKFPVAKDLEGPVRQALTALEEGLTPKLRDHLAQVVSRLLSDGASLDIKRWISGVDHTVDRAGFVLADDLATAIEVIRAGEDPSVQPDMTERVKDLLAFSVSQQYQDIRERLRIAL